MARFLVTGGCGFIGSHLVDELFRSGHQVRVLDNLHTGNPSNLPAGVEVIRGDVRDAKAVTHAMRAVDGCFHLAALIEVEGAEEKRGLIHDVNVGGTINVLHAAARAPQASPPRIVYASSAVVYGDNASVPLSETAELRPLTAYGADKVACELEARLATLNQGVPTAGLRLFNVYGPKQRTDSPYSSALWRLVKPLLRGEEVELGGHGQDGGDWIYVDDAVRFFVAAMQHESSAPELFNVCSGRMTSTGHLLRLLGSLTGLRALTRPVPRYRSDIHTLAGDPSLARRVLHIHTQTDVGTGLRHLLDTLRPEAPSRLGTGPVCPPASLRWPAGQPT